MTFGFKIVEKIFKELEKFPFLITSQFIDQPTYHFNCGTTLSTSTQSKLGQMFESWGPRNVISVHLVNGDEVHLYYRLRPVLGVHLKMMDILDPAQKGEMIERINTLEIPEDMVQLVHRKGCHKYFVVLSSQTAHTWFKPEGTGHIKKL